MAKKQQKSKEKPGLYKYQEETKKIHENQVLAILAEQGPKRFNQLKKITGRAPRGLSKTLADLVNLNKTEQFIDSEQGGIYYKITKTGEKEFHDAFTLSHTLTFIERNGGHLHQDYSDTQSDMWFCYLPWGIRDDLALSKEYDEKSSPISRDFVKDVQMHIYEKLKNNLKQMDLKQLKEKKGQIVLGFDIDVPELVQSLEMDVLKERKRIRPKQMELFSRLQNGKETKDDQEKLGQILKEREKRS